MSKHVHPEQPTAVDTSPAKSVGDIANRAHAIESVTLNTFKQSLTLEQFVQLHDSPVLMWVPPSGPAGPVMATATSARPADQGTLSTAPLDFDRLTSSQLRTVQVFLLRKERTRFGEAIWVGRWSKCDIALDIPTLSRLHAFLTYDNDGTPYLGDGGSKNGTFVEGQQVLKGTTVALPEDAHLILGTVPLRFLQPAALYRALAKLSDKL